MKSSKTDNWYASQLREAGFKATSSKIRLLSILATSKEPLSVESIYAKFKQPAPDMATVYRSLKEFHAKGLIKQVNLQHSHAHYEYGGHEDHHHFVCTNCSLVEDIVDCDMSAVIKKALTSITKFSEATDHSFELFGLCKKCQNQNL